MRCLTVRQPWAYAIMHLGKDVENRARNIVGKYRGPLLIHVSLTVEPAGLDPRIAQAIGERWRGHGAGHPVWRGNPGIDSDLH